MKHIHVKYHYVRELVTDEELTIMQVRSANNAANILTKPLAHGDYLCLCMMLGLRPTSIK
jgi:hypothetical protein